uniref:Caspase n=1 Tax=Pithovirus LCPAC401 TaxID=2506595 RepID=A0A481ZCK9_9VIRU|nr:MAG: caspase [Pithovirus LCPAC401]
MKEAIIIGFSYKQSIPGVFFDIFRVYSFCKKRKFDKISVITDISHDYIDISRTVIKEGFNSDIFNFIETIKLNDEYTMCTTSRMFMKIIERKTRDSKKNILVYYSGHCINSRILLPNDDKVLLVKFKEMFTDCSKILFILDCCNASIDLPYKLKGNTFRSNNTCRDETSQILCICSSSTDEKSALTSEGSLFTRSCFYFLDEEANNRKDINTFLSCTQQDIVDNAAMYSTTLNEKLIRPKQTCAIYSSHPHINTLWGWIVNDLDMEITFHPECMAVLVKINR